MLTPVSLPDLDPFFEPTLIPVLMEIEIEPPIFDRHISLMKKECEFQFSDLEPTVEPKPTIEPKPYFKSYFRVSIGSRTFHFLAQVNYSTELHSIVGLRYRP